MMYHPELILALVRSRRYYRYSGDSSLEGFWICLAVIGGLLLLSFLYGVKFKPVMWLLKIPVYILCFLLIMPYLIAAWVMIICGEILKGLSAFDERILESIPNLFEEKGKKTVKAEPPKPIEPKIDGRISRMEQEIYNLIGRLNQAEDENKVLEKKCGEYEKRERQIKNTLPVILTGIFRKVRDRIEQKKRWENVTPALFEQLIFDRCPNALEQLKFIYRQGGFKHFEGGMEVKKEIISYLEDAFYDLEEEQGEIIRKFIRRFNIEAWRHKFPSYSDKTLDDMIPFEVWDEFLYFGLEDFICHFGVEKLEKPSDDLHLYFDTSKFWEEYLNEKTDDSAGGDAAGDVG